MREESVAAEILEEPAIPAAPTVGRAWELDTFTAPVRGRALGTKEKIGVGLFSVGLVVAGVFLVRPARLREETAAFMKLADTGSPAIDETKANDFARHFLQTLGAEWSPQIFFQHTAPAFWPASAAQANQLAARYTAGFDALREHGRVLAVDLTGPATTSVAPTGEVRTLPCTLEFADGTAFRASVQLARASATQRWSVLALSVLPVLP